MGSRVMAHAEANVVSALKLHRVSWIRRERRIPGNRPRSFHAASCIKTSKETPARQLGEQKVRRLAKKTPWSRK